MRETPALLPPKGVSSTRRVGKKSRRANWKEMRRRERQKQYTFEAGREGGGPKRGKIPQKNFSHDDTESFLGAALIDRDRGSEFLQSSAPSRLRHHPLGGCGCKLVSRTKARPTGAQHRCKQQFSTVHGEECDTSPYGVVAKDRTSFPIPLLRYTSCCAISRSKCRCVVVGDGMRDPGDQGESFEA